MTPLPKFTPRLAPDATPRVPFDAIERCTLCRALDIVDEASGTCRSCWRVVVLWVAVAAGAAD